MELERVDTKRAYKRIRELITTLELEPGSAVDEQSLAQTLDMGSTPVREALKLLTHDNLVDITRRHGLYVSEINVHDLERLSELRLCLEGLSARLASQRATEDDIIILEALRDEQASSDARDSRYLLEVDHRFHQAVAKAAHNRYLAESLERLFGLSQRLWYLALPSLSLLSSAVGKHLELAKAIEQGDGDAAECIMRTHVGEFYASVREVLLSSEGDDSERLES